MSRTKERQRFNHNLQATGAEATATRTVRACQALLENHVQGDGMTVRGKGEPRIGVLGRLGMSKAHVQNLVKAHSGCAYPPAPPVREKEAGGKRAVVRYPRYFVPVDEEVFYPVLYFRADGYKRVNQVDAAYEENPSWNHNLKTLVQGVKEGFLRETTFGEIMKANGKAAV